MKTKTSAIKKNSIWETIKELLLFLMFALIIPVTFETTTLFAQSEFLSENQKQQVYYDSLLNVLGSDSMQGTGYKQYQRWYRYWAPKLSSNYDFDDYQSDLLNYADNYLAPQNNSAAPNWKLIGPNDIPVSGQHSKGTGQIHYIYRDPNDANLQTIYACSPVGGLFKSTDNGERWFNLGTDKGLPRSGVSSVVVDSKASSTLYVTTGNGEGFASEKIWQTAIGVWRTQDNGAHWENIGLGTDNNGKFVYHMRKVIETNNINDSTHLVVTTTTGLYRSKNANKPVPVWDTLIVGEFYDVVQDPINNTIIYASGSDSTGIFKYNLSDNTKTKIFDIDTLDFPYDTIEFPGLRRISIKISQAFEDSTYLFALVSMKDKDFTTIYRYNLASENWHRFHGDNFPNGYARKLGWAIRPVLNDSSQIQILGQNASPHKLFYNGLSNDSESKVNRVRNYNSTGTHDDFHYLLIENDNITVWAGTDGGVYKGEFINDTLIEWIPKNKGLGVATIEFIDAKYGIVTSGQFDCGSNIYRTDDEINWADTMKMGGDGFQTIITSSNSYYMSRENGHIDFYQGNSNPLYYYIGDTISCEPPFKRLDYANFATYYVKLGDKLYAAGQKEVMTYGYPGDPENWIEWSNLETQIGCGISGTWRVAVKDNNGTHQIYASAYQEPGAYQHLYKSIGGGGPNVNYWAKVENTPIEGWINAIEISGNTDSIIVAIKDSIFSVNTTNPLSPVWYNLSYNLNAGTIKSIFREFNNKLWIATERGVYYLIPGTTSWINYTSNLPNCEVRDIKVTNKRVYVGTYGRGVWFASTPDCGNSAAYDTTGPGEQVAPGITTTKYTNLVVPTGNTYTVYGTLEMPVDCKIIVERGAKLIVDGGTITKACPDFWQGIEVRGTAIAAQEFYNQGWVILKNGATIEYAKIAIETIKNENGVSDLTFAGGVVQADSSNFINNRAGVVFHPYPKNYTSIPILDNKSYFKNTTFAWDSSYYYFDDSPKYHIAMYDVKGILFESNTFENSVPYEIAIDEKRGLGISSWNAGCKLTKYPIADTGNVFNKLYYGFKSYAYFGSNKAITIEYSLFNQNKTGCYLSAEIYARVTQNVFNVQTSGLGLSHGYSGLYLDACTGFKVEENEFYSNYDPLNPNSYARSFGLVIHNSGTEDNEIYKNKFHNIGWAAKAQGINRQKGGQTGLQFKCNEFADNYSDIEVNWEGVPNSANGIAYNQGSNANTPTAPAGNQFSRLNESTPDSDFNNYGEDIVYHLPHWQAVQQYLDLKPEYYSSNTIDLSNSLLFPWDPINGCPSNLTTNTRSAIETRISENSNNADIYSDSLDVLIDEGNTVALNLDVTTSIPPETMELRDELLAASPYLSDTVMANAAAKEDVLPNSIITEVLTANPQSAKSESVLNTLDERDNPPNENQMGQILANDTVIGHKETLESKLSFYTSEKVRAVYDLSRFFMVDTTGLAIHDSIELALSNITNPASRYRQTFCRLNSKDSLGVINLLSNIPAEFDLDDAESDYHDYFVDYFDVLLEMQTQNKNIIEIDSTQKATINSIMDNTGGLLHAYARNILILTDGLVYHEPYLLSDTSYNKSTTVKENVFSHLWDEESYFKLYPNPANGYITLEYKLDYGTSQPVVEMISVDGVHISTFSLFNSTGIKIIDLRDWNSGTYIIRLTSNGRMLQSAKFVKL